jgi:class 3 adenylate cyclase/tetratricopeptide (TPR) repeat protein
VITCPSCGSENRADAKFCSECGYRFAPAGGLLEERKVVTVVFCDLVGSTARAERADPEDVRAELSAYHEHVRHELERHGGTVEKFIGDAVVAVFGAPVVHEDDPERAVRAALAIRDWALEEGGLDLRVAVNTGETLVSVGARPEAGEGLVAGDVVNTAARLQAAAPVNGVLVGAATRRATERAIDYRPRDAVEAKGKQEPVPVWEALSARSLYGVDVDLQPRTRLVGRRRELDQLLDSLARARAEREPQLVTIVGVPGMGKSRLVQELSTAVADDPDLIRWRQGRSLPYGQGVSYWALGEMVKGEAGILESDTTDVARSKLHEAVAAVLAGQDVEWIESMLRPLVGLAEHASGADRRGEAFAAWRRFLESLADQRPTVLVFEDLHWADDGVLDFVDSLVDWATDVPLLVVATARPELLARRPAWGGGKPNAATLSLAPLSESETAELVHAILERSVLPAGVQAAVLARAGGNPLYAEEFARMVSEQGPGVREEDLRLPESLQGLISARLDALTRDEKGLLQEAAVVGKVFWRGVLTTGGRQGLDAALHALERKEFVRRERRSSVAGEDQYAFRHVLVRDVAYDQLPRAVRAERHRQVAEWIERRVRAEDAAELLAHHYLSALEYSRALGRDDSELADRARGALREAGRRAVALNAFASAARFFDLAVELTPEDDVEWALLALERAEASTYVDLTNDQLLLRARERLLAGDVHDAARAELVLGEYAWLRGDRTVADDYLRAAEALASEMTDGHARLRVLATVSRFAMLDDEYDHAITIGRQGLELAEALGRDDMRAHVLNSIGVARVSRGDRDGLVDLERSREIARVVNAPEYLRACGNLGSVLGIEGQLGRAAELHREALEVAQKIGYVEPTRWLQSEVAIDQILFGEWDEGWQIVEEVIPTYERTPFWIEPQTRVSRARILVARGAVAQAVADADRAVELGRDGRTFQSVCDPFAFRARLHVELGQLDDAARVLRELLDRWSETGSGYVDQWVIDAWYAAWRTGSEERLQADIDQRHQTPWLQAASALVRRDFDTAAGLLDGIGAVSVGALVRLWAAEWLDEQGRRPEANAHLEQSLAFWQSVGATGYAQRSESLRAA